MSYFNQRYIPYYLYLVYHLHFLDTDLFIHGENAGDIYYVLKYDPVVEPNIKFRIFKVTRKKAHSVVVLFSK